MHHVAIRNVCMIDGENKKLWICINNNDYGRIQAPYKRQAILPCELFHWLYWIIHITHPHPPYTPHMSIAYQNLSLSQSVEVSILESAHYPSDEGASIETIEYRLKHCPELFFGCCLDDVLIGFVNGTTCLEKTLTHETMFHHEPNGTTLCIHSVVIDKSHQRKGLGISMLLAYLAHIQKNTKVSNVLLLCKPKMIQFYEKCGFISNGVSSVIHGSEQWIEMELSFPTH